MRKSPLVLALLAVLLAAACSPAAPVPTATIRPTQASTKPPAQANCTVSSSLMPTAGPTEASLFAPVNDNDWVEGAKNPSVTIIEYSDFQ
jgi:hypothetical protein